MPLSRAPQQHPLPRGTRRHKSQACRSIQTRHTSRSWAAWPSPPCKNRRLMRTIHNSRNKCSLGNRGGCYKVCQPSSSHRANHCTRQSEGRHEPPVCNHAPRCQWAHCKNRRMGLTRTPHSSPCSWFRKANRTHSRIANSRRLHTCLECCHAYKWLCPSTSHTWCL